MISSSVIHVIPAVSEEASGPTYVVLRLCESLIAAGENLTLAAMNWSNDRSPRDFVRLFPMGLGPKRLGSSPELFRWLRDQTHAGGVDVIHSNGMWQMNAVYPGRVARGGKTRLVVSPHGSFSTWAMKHGSPLKRVFWPLLQRPALEQASCFHATAKAELDDIRRLGFRQPVAIIPSGIDVPPLARETSGPMRTLLFLGRIHPVKGVDVLLNAWSRVMHRFPQWQLKIAGSDDGYHSGGGYLAEMKALAARLRLERLDFVGPRYGDGKLSAYREAELFVLPSHSENFGITVAEAQAAGTAVIVTRGAPWAGVVEHDSGWWIDIGADALVACLEVALAQPREDLAQRGMRGREWMLREYAWPTIADKMQRTYRWLVKGGSAPAWVHTS
jgi:glycosyltransferase involved in cell wall biosynthesis